MLVRCLQNVSKHRVDRRCENKHVDLVRGQHAEGGILDSHDTNLRTSWQQVTRQGRGQTSISVGLKSIETTWLSVLMASCDAMRAARQRGVPQASIVWL